jgi:hypothetical protein
MNSTHFNRRAFLIAGGMSYFGIDLAARAAQAVEPTRRNPAKSTIMIFLAGGASHIDTWDMKPDAPEEYRGTFKPAATSTPGIQLCEHLPFLAKQMHHLAIVRSLGDFKRGTGDHHAGFYYNLTGHAPDRSFHQLLNARKPYGTDWPSMASVVSFKRPPHPQLPSAITLPHKEGAPEYTRPGQFAARLGIEYDPVFVEGTRERPLDFAVPALTLSGEISAERMTDRRTLLQAIDHAQRLAEGAMMGTDYRVHQRKAFTLLSSRTTKAAFDLLAEPEKVRERYGNGINSTSMLLARRLVEAGVPFVTVFWKEDKELNTLCKSGGSWDTHGNNFNCPQRPAFAGVRSTVRGPLRRSASARPARVNSGHGDERNGPQTEGRRSTFGRRQRRWARSLDRVPVGIVGRWRHSRRASVRYHR